MRALNQIAVFLVSAVLATPLAATASGPRSPAEWEPVQGVVVGWFENDFIHLQSMARDYGGWTAPALQAYTDFRTEHLELVKALLQADVDVFILDNAQNSYSLPDTLAQWGLVSPRLRTVAADDADQWKPSVYQPWLRDNGPFFVYQREVESLAVYGWPGDVGAEVAAGVLGMPYNQLDLDVRYYTDGGNYLVDGHGQLFCDAFSRPDEVLEGDRIEDEWRTRFGMRELVELPPYRIHADYYLKLVDEETFFVADIPSSNYLGDESFQGDNELIDRAVQILEANAVSCHGRPYTFVRIPNAPSYRNHEEQCEYETADASYVNSLIVNHTVIVPTFDNPATDAAALDLYREHMPGYRVVGVPARRYAERGGGVHCASREIPAEEPVVLTHARLPARVKQAGEYRIEARIRAASGISEAVLYWRAEPGAAFAAGPMQPLGPDRFTAAIPGQGQGVWVEYYLEAYSIDGTVGRKPPVAPAGTYAFLVDQDGGTTDVAHLDADETTPAGASLGRNYPNPFNSSTTIGYFLPRATRVEVSVYNTVGERVTTLVAEQKPRGIHAVTWDASGLAAGVYFYGIQAEDHSDARRCILVR